MTDRNSSRGKQDGLRFWKMTGAGNDFLLIDCREWPPGEDIARWVREVCRRGISVGADGAIFVDHLGGDRWKVRFFNPDGEETFCANGARCATRFAVLRNRAATPLVLETVRGPLRSVVEGDRVRLELGRCHIVNLDLQLTVGAETFQGSLIHVGVPHLVIFHPDPGAVDLIRLGGKLRAHPDLGPEGANVNFVRREPGGRLWVRTYERGVEGETRSCGTGSVAAVLVAACRGFADSPTVCRNLSGSDLRVSFRRDGDRFREVFLEGEARLVYTGTLPGGVGEPA